MGCERKSKRCLYNVSGVSFSTLTGTVSFGTKFTNVCFEVMLHFPAAIFVQEPFPPSNYRCLLKWWSAWGALFFFLFFLNLLYSKETWLCCTKHPLKGPWLQSGVKTDINMLSAPQSKQSPCSFQTFQSCYSGTAFSIKLSTINGSPLDREALATGMYAGAWQCVSWWSFRDASLERLLL